MVRFMRYSTLFRFYEVFQPFIQFSPGVEVSLPGKKALVIAPHPDDESIGCGGTVAAHVQGGGAAEVVFCVSDGPERDAESENAAKILGFSKIHRYGLKDESLGSGLAGKLRQTLDEVKPDVVFIPFMLDNHSDHRAASAALAEARPADESFMVYAYPVWLPLYPNVLVDVSRQQDTKEKAIGCYKSQLATRDYVKLSRSLGGYWASVKGRGMEAAESFFRATYSEYRSLVKKL